MNQTINQEFVNNNIDKIIEFMGTLYEPDVVARQSSNWKKSLLKDFTNKECYVIAYQKYTEGVNMMTNYTQRVNKFYDKELELEERAMREESALGKEIAHNKVWRHTAMEFRDKLIELMGRNGYENFLDESGLSKYSSYYGL
tara:strand:+ start:40 stop:465 length:426 start_codon:yes stop_codon:yes gene_type:complete